MPLPTPGRDPARWTKTKRQSVPPMTLVVKPLCHYIGVVGLPGDVAEVCVLAAKIVVEKAERDFLSPPQIRHLAALAFLDGCY